MPRDISRNRDSLGSSKKTSPKVKDSDVQKALDTVYRELNNLKQSVNKEAIGSQARPNEGKSGDMRLYTKKGLDGTVSHYIQAKFGEFWASGRLGVDEIDPELRDVVQSVVPDLDLGDDEYITKLGVTFENLDSNGDIGFLSTQVPKGDHTHSHLLLTDKGVKLHTEIDTHIDTANIHFLVADIATTATVTDTADVGNSPNAARSDHIHKLDTETSYTWTKTQVFNPISGNAITTGGDLYVGGDATITGDLTVDYSQTGDENNNAVIGNDLTVGGDTILKKDLEVNNEGIGGNNYSDTYSTTVRGKINAFNEVSIQHQLSGSDAQLTLKHDANNKIEFSVSDTGFATIKVTGTDGPNSLQFDGVSFRPKDNLTSDLGHIDKKWNTIYAGELFVENLVAQEVMATVGGRIMVAPTTKLHNSITSTSSGIQVEHNIFAQGDIGFMQSAPNGFAQTEAIRFTSQPVPTDIQDPVTATNAGQDAIDYFVGAGITKLVSFSSAHGCEHGQYITINHDTTLNTDQWTGPDSTTNVYQVYIETDSSKLPTYFNSATTLYLALPSAAQQTPVASEISITSTPYTYTIARNINDDSGANAWPKDTAIVNWGKDEGDGYIDITATQGVYSQLGPHISLKARKQNVGGNNADWLVPEIARIGNMDGTGYTGTRSFGLMVGENIENSPIAASNPFKGLQAGDEGVKLYNSNLETYTGTSRTIYLGQDLRTGNDYANKSSFLLGEGISVNGSNEYENASLIYAWNNVSDKYVLTIDGAIDIVSDNFYDSPEDVFNNLPNFDMSENPSTSGLYLTPHYLGFYSGSDWPLVIGSSGTNNGDLTEDNGIEAFARIGVDGDSKGFLKYTQTDGLEVSGKVTVTNPTNFVLLYQSTIDFQLYTNQTWTKPIGANQETGIHYIHILALDAEQGNGAVPSFSQNHNTESDPDGSSATWTSLGDAMVGADEQLKWYSFAADFTSIGTQNSIRVTGNGVDQVFIKGLVITTGHPGDPQSILSSAQANELAGNHSATLYQATQPPGSNYNIGDQWVDTDDGNNLYIWNGTAWEATFTAIDGGQITTGTITGLELKSSTTFTDDDSNTIARTTLNMGGANRLQQYSSGANPERYTELDGGTLRYFHESSPGEGVANSSSPLEYRLPRAMQIVRATDFNLGSINTFASLNLTDMYTSNYQVIPIPKTTIATGQQDISDLQTINGIAREEVFYDIYDKTRTGFKMTARLYRGEAIDMAGGSNFPMSDTEDDLDSSNDADTGLPQGGGVNPTIPQPNSSFFNNSYDLPDTEYTFCEGNMNSNIVGGVNMFSYKINISYREILYMDCFDFQGTTMCGYPGFPGKTYFYFMLRVGNGIGSPFANDGTFHTVTPVGFGGDIEDNDLKVEVINQGLSAFSTDDADSWPSGSDSESGYNYMSWPRSINVTFTWNSPDNIQIAEPRIELVCFHCARESTGSTGGIGYESPRLSYAGDKITLLEVKHGQQAQLIEEITGTGKVGALVADGLNISS